ncbi:Clavaminate synthase-like protein, partial [Xylona heveae TC161]
MDDVLRDDQNNTHLSHEAETLAGQGAVCAGCNFSRNTLDGDTNDATSWISCDGCKRWFHFACAGFKNEREVRSVDKFNCRECRPTCGPTTFVRKSSRAHTAIDYAELNEGIIRVTDESPEHHYIKPIKEGTIKFLPDNFLRMPPELVTADFFEKGNGMKEPVVIPAHLNPRPQVWASAEDVKRYPEQPQEPAIENGDDGSSDILYDEVPDVGQDALDMVIPQNLSVQDVAELYGPEEKVEVIDVKSQEGEGKNWNMRRWADYYESKGDKVIRNVISLEVSSSKLGRLIRRPKVVRDLDLQDSVWPAEGKAKGDFPKVQFYCLMSVADCFTDFHIDFGGSSVFYHVLKGKKTFFFISPKQKNLKKYEEWCMSPAQNWTFLPDQTKECYRVDLSEGDTMLIPSGWIHAVWTPENSLVIGGNFLTRLNYGMQIRIAEVEKATKVARKFRYPHFQKVLWYTAIKYLEDDPLPESVINDFYSGRKFSRETPTYYDFNKWGDNSTPGAENYHSRYYSQYELEGLPDLARYLLRTALISMGNITDGITVDTRNAVTRSIPKGHGEPLQIVKNFAMWSAWKRGNEHIPHWAYPDVVPAEALPKSQGKKLSAAAIKKLERQAAMEAYRAAPERQSVRQQSQAEAAALKRADGSPTKVEPVWGEDRKRKASTSSTANGVMDGHTPKRPKKALSTPKTSVLGPRRVACDACRRRRIRCKHKDDLLSGSATSHHGAPSVFVPVTGYPTFSRDLNSDFGPDYSVQNGEVPSFVTNSSRLPTEAIQATNVASGDQAPMQTPDARKIRNKACSNCRKSKRRCIHDEYGNVDPIKVQEASMSRTSGASAKRRAKVDEQDPRAPKKVKRE